MSNILKFRYIYLSLVIFLISDLLLVIFPKLNNFNVSTILKGSVLAFFCVLAYKTLNKKALALLFSFIVIFFTSQLYLLIYEKINISGVITNLQFFVWYLFALTLMLMHNIQSKNSYEINTIRVFNNIAIVIISVICFTIIIGFLFDVKAFWSYKGERWGFKGVLSKSVTASYFFIFVLSYLYYKEIVIKRRFVVFLSVLFCALLCGTKTIYFFIILLFIFHFIKEKKYTSKWFWVILSLLLIAIYFFRKLLLQKTEFIWIEFYKAFIEKGFIYSFTSFRSEMLKEGIQYYTLKWDWINYLIGGRLTEIKYFEMTFFDLFYFFGIFGFLLFLFVLVRYFVNPFLKETKNLGLFIVISVFLASFFTGQFFINSTVIMIMFFFITLIQINFQLNEQNKYT
jgi:hypothetical protein